MHPVFKPIAINGALAAAVLAGLGYILAHMAEMWTVSTAGRPQPGSASPPPLTETLTPRVPVMMAVWGFVFVTVGELVRWRRRGSRVAEPSDGQQPDDTEKLLNELLAQAESRMVAEQATENREPAAEDRQQVTRTPD